MVALVKGGRRGARESQRAQNTAAFVGIWASLLAKKAMKKSLGGVSLPLRCWLVATDQRLLVLSTSRWSSDSKDGRDIILSRVRGAKLRPPSEAMAYARVALMDNRDLEVEVPLRDVSKLKTFVDAVQAAAGEHGANRPRSYRSVMG